MLHRTLSSTSLPTYTHLRTIRSIPSIFMTNKILYNYHMSYLMDSKHDDRFVKIDRRAFHLYRDSLLNFPSQPFNQKIFLTILIDTVRTKQKYQDFQKLVQFGIKHIDQFKQPISIFNFATQLYLYNYSKKQQSLILAKKGFEFFRTCATMKFSSYYVMKFLIFLQKNVGLLKFTDEEYKLINFTRFKPLFLCFTLQMFYENKLQHYTTIQQVFKLFTSSESIIPFADIHHYKKAIKNITDPRFKEFVDNLSNRLIDQRDNDDNDKLNGNHNLKGVENDGLQGENDKIEEIILSENDEFKSINVNKVTKTNNNIYPWEKAYANHVYRQFTYYPSFNSSHNHQSQSKHKHTHKN